MAKKLVKKKKKAAPAKKAAAGKKVAKAAGAKKAAKKAAPAKKAAAPVKKKAAKRTKEVRLKAFWGVFNQSLRRIALFEFNERKQADKKAAELTKSGKSPHFVQPVKEQIVDG
jgi:hypothetical protein